jgi:hypothetical protein
MTLLGSFAHHWEGWTGVAASMITISSAVAGCRRLRRKASERADKRNWQLKRRSGTQELLRLVAKLRAVVHDLDSALKSGNLDSIRWNLGVWRRYVSEAYGILSAVSPEDKAVLRCLEKSRKCAATASKIPPRRDGFVASDYSEARAAMTDACDLLDSWAAGNSTQGFSSGDG